jgi:hypothetical protein
MTGPIPEPAKDHRRMKRKLGKKSVAVTKLGKKSVAVTCRKGTLGLGPNLAIRMHDVSVDGVQLIVKSALVKGDVIEIGFSAPGLPSKLNREAVVVWCSGSESEGFRIGARLRVPLEYGHIYYMT